MGALSGYSIGVGSYVKTQAELLSIPSGSLRPGDLAFVSGDGTAAKNGYYAFIPWSTTAVGNTVAYADIANSTPGTAGRWHQLTLAITTAPTPVWQP